MGGIEGHRMLSAFAKSGLASLVMGAALLGWQTVLPDASGLVLGGGGIVLGAAVYAVAALLLRVEELQLVMRLILRRQAK
jgi:hypothetical protein